VPPPPPPAKRSPNRKVLLVGLVVAVLLLAVVVGYALDQAAQPQPATLAGLGSVYNVPPGGYEAVHFTITRSGEVTGSVASSSPMTVYLMGPGEFTSFSANASHTGSTWSSGVTEGTTIDVSVPSGTWYLLFVPATSSAALQVQVTQALVVSPT
jgi:hypothetical protein